MKNTIWLFCVILFIKFSDADDDLNVSPCPSHFQYGLLRGKLIGSMNLLIPRTKVYGFTVTQVFVPLVGEINGFPQVKLRKKEEPKAVVEDILNGRKVNFITQYPQAALDFKLIKILLNDEVICEEANVNPQDLKFVYRATEQFEPPSNLISTFKEFFPIEFNQQNCGTSVSKKDNSSFILTSHGGEHAKWSEFPWIASVYVHGEYKCTANLISRNIAICAAHCFDNANYKSVLLGLYNKKNSTIWGYLKHQDHYKYKNDIALVFLESDIDDSDFSPICLWEFHPDFTNDIGQMVSFGETEFEEAGLITKISLNAVSKEVCRDSNSELKLLVQENHFCAGNLDGTGPCAGDSGAGLMMTHNSKWYLRGILSTALKNKETNNCDTYNFAIFMDILKFLPWISNEYKKKAHEGAGPALTSSCGDYGQSPSRSFKPEDQTWAVRIVFKNDGTYIHTALIAPNWVIARAYELSGKEVDNVKVRTMDGKEIDAEQIIVHEKFKRDNFYRHNIALVKLKSSFPSTVKNVCLDRVPSQSSDNIVFGMDWTKYDVPIMSREECARKVNTGTYTLEDYNFCAPKINNVVVDLVFDLHNSIDGQSYWAHFGTVSVLYGDFCLYTDLSYYVDWIKSKIA